jgi:hypothetical protein
MRQAMKTIPTAILAALVRGNAWADSNPVAKVTGGRTRGAPRRRAQPRDLRLETPQAPTVRVARKIALRKSKTTDIWLNGLLTLAVVAALVIWARTMLEMISEMVGLIPFR